MYMKKLKIDSMNKLVTNILKSLIKALSLQNNKEVLFSIESNEVYVRK